MNYEKKYKEALEWARKVMQGEVGFVLDEVLEKFPELAESEDEKMVKFIKKQLFDVKKTITENYELDAKLTKAIDWLEKQGKQNLANSAKTCKVEQNPNPCDGCINRKGCINCENGELREVEQKPADKVEPKFKVKYAGSEYNVLEVKDSAGITFYGIEDEPNHIDYVPSNDCEIVSDCSYCVNENGIPYPTKPALFSEQNPAWSEEDELHIRELESLVKQEWAIAEHGNDKDKIHKMSDLSFFLKTLKPQLKQEWSEEDEIALSDALWCCKQAASIAKDENDMGNIWYAENWLKSLKGRYTWKPSEEQMKALSAINVTGGISYAGQGQELINLFSDLKKLRG